MFTRYIIAVVVTAVLAGTADAASSTVPDSLSLKLSTDLSSTSTSLQPAAGLNTSPLPASWSATRANLNDRGISLELSHKSDFLSDISGGIKRGAAWMGYTEAGAALDLEKLLGWHATTAYIVFHSALGSKFNRDYAGTFVGVDNIETSVNTGQFYHAWIQKNFADDTLSVLAGLYPVDSEFYVTDSSSLFIQPPYGMANDMAQGGLVGPPIYPLGALALRLKYTSPGKNYYAQYALTDGVPGDPDNFYGTHIQLNKGDGTLSVMEFGLTPQAVVASDSASEATPQEEIESFNKTALGYWRYTTQFGDLIDSTVSRPDRGIYFLAERSLMARKDHPERGMAGFVRFGTANRDLHQADWTGSIGLRYRGLFAGRGDDIAGIAITYNHASDKFLQLNPGAADNQTQVEATYRAQLKSWLALQPTLQYIANPNMKLDPSGSPVLQNVWILGARAEVNL